MKGKKRRVLTVISCINAFKELLSQVEHTRPCTSEPRLFQVGHIRSIEHRICLTRNNVPRWRDEEGLRTNGDTDVRQKGFHTRVESKHTMESAAVGYDSTVVCISHVKECVTILEKFVLNLSLIIEGKGNHTMGDRNQADQCPCGRTWGRLN